MSRPAHVSPDPGGCRSATLSGVTQLLADDALDDAGSTCLASLTA